MLPIFFNEKLLGALSARRYGDNANANFRATALNQDLMETVRKFLGPAML
ncbi:MAG: hypothetical protein M2R45_05197 [Verrucomicrobia subdivision 3 bacterium]|nr:hypothetical protein [Limisphaerales bacterium]